MKHRILRKIRATFLSLSEEKKATSAGVKRLRRSRRPLAYSLGKNSLSITCSISISFYLELRYTILWLLLAGNRPFSHCLCACVYRSRGTLFLDNRRDFTEMGQTDFKPLKLSM